MVELEPFTSEDFGISGVVPVGWNEATPGTFMRGTPPTDITTLIQKSYPDTTGDELTAQLLPALGIEELPGSVGSREASAFTWDLYKVEVEAPGVGTVVVDIALAETDSTAYLVLLQALADDYEALHEAVFLAAVEALAPLA